ncbi:hypothetical protein SAMN02745121_05677 [Nannocystis exedens]|uniref:Calcineurin-like phosphoesterase domain-containing protein n=1 Tax=Nannocystis exedens TaxID=54 RepID=A0A1I2DPV8_9BACT|nr:metallophosphoesterase [Nannocystis exedens]PCC68990.1 metallophosphoesterase [Nannocystis exedens]SFE82634.1 hypothetical protein SAMN02745121_05677 [Nannocystis exedens]
MAFRRSMRAGIFLGGYVFSAACHVDMPPELANAAHVPCGNGEPRAWVMAPELEALSARLEAAGFTVDPLPLDRSPWGLDGLIVLGSGASELPEYAEYMQSYADDLYFFVDEANVLLELAQSADAEAVPPFLPTTHTARRGAAKLVELEVLDPDHPLLAGVEIDGGRLAWRGELGRDAFVEQGGFEVVLAGAGDGSNGALLEGAYGQGRIVLASLPLDAPTGSDLQQEAFITHFFANLATHVEGVCVRKTSPIKPTPPPQSLPFTAGSTVFAVLPDTQVYSLRYPGVFDAQTSWIARNAEALNIAYAFHLGDIVNNNTELEWRRASGSMSLLDGIVPYGIVPGNHDYGPSGDASTRDTLMNEHFDFEDAKLNPSFGGAFEEGKLDNTYHLFSAGGHEWIAIMLEWGPRDAVIDWANAVMEQHPDRLGIFVTHAYLNNNDRRYDHKDASFPQDFNPHEYDTPGGVNDGEELWQKLVRRHRFVLTLNGHVLGDGTGYLESVTDRGNVVHQMLANYQMRELGGEGYLRLLELLPDGKTMHVRSYSPLFDRYLLGSDQQYTIELDVE